MGEIRGHVNFYLADSKQPLVSIEFDGSKDSLKKIKVCEKFSGKHDVDKLDFSNCAVETGATIEEQKKKTIVAESFQNKSNFKELTVYKLLTDFYGEDFTGFKKKSPNPFANPPFFVRVKNIKSNA